MVRNLKKSIKYNINNNVFGIINPSLSGVSNSSNASYWLSKRFNVIALMLLWGTRRL